MDPNAALRELIDAVLAQEWDDAQERLDALRGWTGFAPRDPRN